MLNDALRFDLGGSRRVPIELQSETAECGLACLAMVANFHGLNSDLLSLRGKYAPTLRGINLSSLISIANDLGLLSRALRLEMPALGKLRTPCILHWNMDHFVVLERVGKKDVTIVDPSIGRRRVSWTEADESFTGVALELMPGRSFRPLNETKKIRFGELFTNSTGLRKSLLVILGLSVSIQALSLLSPLYMQIVIDEVLSSRDLGLLTILAIAFTFVGMLGLTISAIRMFLILRLSTILQFTWAANLFSHLVRLPLTFFERRSVGDINSKFRSITAVQNIVSNTIVESIVDGLMAISTLALMLYYSPLLSAIPIMAVTVYAVVRAGAYRTQKELADEALVSQAKENSHFLETLRGILTIKCYSKEVVRESIWQNFSAESVRKSTRNNFFTSTWSLANQLLLLVEGVAVVWLGARYINDGVLTLGMLTAYISYKVQFTSRAIALIDKILEFKLTSVHLDRIADIVNTEEDEAVKSVAPEGDKISGPIAIRDVSFRYSKLDPYVIRNCNLDIGEGECIAIHAPSGTGKTTLIKLLVGVMKPETGVITLAGHDINAEIAAVYRASIAVVMQEDTLLTGSIADNITFFDLDRNHERIVACAEAAEIHETISRFPMNYNTLVGDMGGALSGGQRQRLLIARALYRMPKILLMDEATSHLDVQAERKIHQTLRSMNITRVLISHRPETLAIADRVYSLRELMGEGIGSTRLPVENRLAS